VDQDGYRNITKQPGFFPVAEQAGLAASGKVQIVSAGTPKGLTMMQFTGITTLTKPIVGTAYLDTGTTLAFTNDATGSYYECNADFTTIVEKSLGVQVSFFDSNDSRIACDGVKVYVPLVGGKVEAINGATVNIYIVFATATALSIFFDEATNRLLAGALDGTNAVLLESTDDGATWPEINQCVPALNNSMLRYIASNSEAGNSSGNAAIAMAYAKANVAKYGKETDSAARKAWVFIKPRNHCKAS